MLDIRKNRKSKKWTRRELLIRGLWECSYIFFRMSPRQFWGWRRFLLRMFGARIGVGVHIFPTAKIAIPWNLSVGDYSSIGDSVRIYALGKISIGSRSTISQGAHLCAGTHDISSPDRPLVKSSIGIGDDVWVAADAFVGPDVRIERGAIVGARAVVVKNIGSYLLVVGNPAVVVRSLDEK